MKSRLSQWYQDRISEMSEKELAECICNGDIITPEWLAYSPTTSIGFAIWDNEVSDGSMRLINLEI